MGTIKNATYKVDNGTDFDEIHFITKWANITEKPTTFYTHPSTQPSTIITQDATHRFITDVERSKWNMPNGSSYVKLPSGHVIQWGTAKNVPHEGIRITLPLAYTTVLTAQATTSIGEYSAGADFVSTSQLKIFNPISAVLIPYVYWMTIGVI